MDAIRQLRHQMSSSGLDALVITKLTNCRYLSGFTGDNCCLLLTPSDTILLTDSRYTEQAKIEAGAFQVIEYRGPLIAALGGIFRQNQIARVGLEKETITISVFEEYTNSLPQMVFIPLTDQVDPLRQTKKADELDKLRHAAEITDKAFLHILDLIKPGMTENEIAFEIEFFMKRLGAEKKSFEIIVASGPRGALPHGVASAKVIENGEMVTLDFGCVYQGYYSDMTRTIFMGQPNQKQRQIYDLVLKAQESALQAIKPGISGNYVDSTARDIISKGGYGDNFGHGLGHGIGLDIHEGPRLAPNVVNILEAGMVVTVEPGIYLPGWGGVRIEDSVVITERSVELLSKSPKGIICC